MLKKLTLKNYRSYRNQTFEFHSGINGLVGLPQSGKTNVIRAIIWLAYNRPSTTKYRSKFSRPNSKTKVSALLDNGYTISLMKSQSTSVYEIKHPTREFHRYTKFGVQVPDTITEVLNLSELNIQNQIERVYLAASTPGEIARTINRVTKTDDIDKWVKNINQKTNVLKSRKEGIVQDIEEIEDKLSQFEGLDSLDGKLSKLSKLIKKRDKLDKEYYRIQDLMASIESSKKEIENCHTLLAAKDHVNKILKLQKIDDRLSEEYDNIKSYLQEKENVKDIKGHLKYLIKKYTSQLKKEKICPTCFSKIGNKDIRRITNALYATQ